MNAEEVAAYRAHLAQLRPVVLELVRLCAQMKGLEVQMRAVGLLVPDPDSCPHPELPCSVCLGIDPEDLLRDLGVIEILKAIDFGYPRLRLYLRR